jgi:uncharacterized protein YdhG (YjbR/CyaY superfamily)
MQSKAETVDEYLAEVPPERRAALEHIRALCLKHLVGYTEAMGYGMPGYDRDGQGEVGFASQKNYISLYITKEEAAAVGKAKIEGRRGVSYGKGCFRFTKPEHIDFDVVEEMLKATVVSDDVPC